MGAYIRYRERPDRRSYVLVLLAFICGLMSKAMLVTLPVVLILVDFWPLGRLHPTADGESRWGVLRKLTIEKWPMFALAAASSIVTIVIMSRGGSMSGINDMSMGVRVANAAVGYVGYMLKMFWPQGLTVMYPHPLNTLPVWQVIGSELLLAGITIISLRSAGRRPYILFGWLWYVITLFPVCGLIQQGLGAVTDHFTYIPMIGLFVIVAWGVPDILAWKRKELSTFQRWSLAAVSVVVVIALSLCSNVQLGYWKDSVTLFRQALRVTSNNARVIFNWPRLLKKTVI